MRKVFGFLILTSCLLFVTDWMICDFMFPELSGSTEDELKIIRTQWHILRNKFESFEFFLLLSGLIIALKGFKWFVNLDYLFRDRETDYAVRFTICYWQFCFGDLLDRVFFDVNYFNWNDWFIYGWVAYYLYKTIKLYVSTNRKNI